MYIHFGWNPWLFFGVLGFSFVLVSVLKKVPAVWVLPAFVLYFGLDWELSSPWSLLFKLVFWFAVIMVLVTAVLPAKTKLAKVPLASVSVVIVLGLFGNVIDWWDSPDGNLQADISQTTPDKNSSSNANCEDGFVQKDITDEKLNRFIEGGINAKTAVKSSDKLLEAVGHDASSLRFYARTFNLDNIPSEGAMLTADKTCLSEKGQQLHHDLSVVMKASGQKFKKAPENAYNSGVDNKGNPVVDPKSGLRGNTKAVEYTLADGSKVYILVRCGNPVFASPPKDVPPGETDNPPPPPKEECPPGTTGTPPDCIEPKDYRQGTQHQSNNKPGGGGKAPAQTDNEGPPAAGNPPATYDPPPKPAPKPTPRPTPPPPAEGGDGGGNNDNSGDPGAP